MPRYLVAALAMILLTALAVAAPKLKTLSAQEIRQRLVAHEITDGFHWNYYLKPDGSIDGFEMGRQCTLFILDWLQSAELRRRVHAGLNKGEARNALARVVFFNRLSEIRDRSFEQQRYWASGLNLVAAAIVLWNTVYLERAANALRDHDQTVDDALLQYLSPLGWEHINLTGDYLWCSSAKIGAGKFRSLRLLQPA